MDRAEARRAYRGTDLRAATAGGDSRRVDAARRDKGAPEYVRLRIGAIFAASAATGIGLAGEHEGLDPLRTAKGIQGLQ